MRSLLVTCKILAEFDLMLYLYLDSLMGYWFLFCGRESLAKSWWPFTGTKFMSSHLHVSVSLKLGYIYPGRWGHIRYQIRLHFFCSWIALLITSFSICTNISKNRGCFARQYESGAPLSCLVFSCSSSLVFSDIHDLAHLPIISHFIFPESVEGLLRWSASFLKI